MTAAPSSSQPEGESLPDRLRLNSCRRSHESADRAATRRIETEFEAADTNEIADAILALSSPVPSSPKGGAETDTLADLVARFSAALLEKLRAAEAKGRSGWDAPNWERECVEGLHRHANKGDPRDVAAYAAFCWHHGWATTPSPLPSSPKGAETRGNAADSVIKFLEQCGEADIEAGVGAVFGLGSPEEKAAFKAGIAVAIERHMGIITYTPATDSERAALAERVEKDLVASCLERLIVALRQAAKDSNHDR